MKTYNGWKGQTPAKAIRNMLEFHEGKKAAKMFAERMVEADEIIKSAIQQNTSNIKEYSTNREYQWELENKFQDILKKKPFPKTL